MIRRERKFYTEVFKERVLRAYYNSNESVSQIAKRYGVSGNTVGTWVYRSRVSSGSKKRGKLAPSETVFMKREEMLPASKDGRICELERALAKAELRSECLEKMIEIAERELKIDIRKKSGAKQSTR